MAALFNKFQEFVRTLAKSPTFAKDPRKLQLEADINRLFLYTSYNRLGKDTETADVDEIIDMASKAAVAEQQHQVQENVHNQIKAFCTFMDETLLPDKTTKEPVDTAQQSSYNQRQSGLGFAVGNTGTPREVSSIPQTFPLTQVEIAQRLKDCVGFKLDVRPSQIPHPEAGQGLFIDGEADVGSVVALYPGIIYSPAYYRYIPGYPRVDLRNPYLITRYDGFVINAQPWGSGGETREVWGASHSSQMGNQAQSVEKGPDRLWKFLSKPLEGTQKGSSRDILERRNPLALAHFANHPAKDMEPNVMICPYDFPLTESEMRVYIPNILFGNSEPNMRRFGSFWFKTGSSNSVSDIPVLRTLVLVTTRAIRDEEVLLNYRLSNSKRRPAWYSPVDEEEDRRRWS